MIGLGFPNSSPHGPRASEAPPRELRDPCSGPRLCSSDLAADIGTRMVGGALVRPRALAVAYVLLMLASLPARADDGRGTPAIVSLGYLEGTVRLTPACPVETARAPCPVPPGAYVGREILVRTAGEVVARAALDPHGHYRVALPAGTYVVDINHVGMDASADVPRAIGVRRGETVRVDIAIDTGIR